MQLEATLPPKGHSEADTRPLDVSAGDSGGLQVAVPLLPGRGTQRQQNKRRKTFVAHSQGRDTCPGR